MLSCIKDTHKKNTPSNKTRATKSKNMCFWVIGTLNQVFMSLVEIIILESSFQNNKIVENLW